MFNAYMIICNGENFKTLRHKTSPKMTAVAMYVVVRYPRYLDTFVDTYVTVPVSPRSRSTAVYRSSKNIVKRRLHREYRR